MNETADIYVPQDPYSKPYVVLSFSRQTLKSLGFTYEQVSCLTDEDLVRIAQVLQSLYPGFEESVQFITALRLAERSNR